MTHEIKKEEVDINLKLTLKEFEYLFSAASLNWRKHKELHEAFGFDDYSDEEAQELFDQLEKINESIK